MIADLLSRFWDGRPCRVIESGGHPFRARLSLAHWRVDPGVAIHPPVPEA